MPTVLGTDLFSHNDFSLPGGGPYASIDGSPQADFAVVRPGDPASLLLDTTSGEAVAYTITGSRTRPWMGVFARINTGGIPASSFAYMIRFFHTGGSGNVGSVGYSTYANSLYTEIGGNQFATFTLDVWHWLEAIFDLSGTTHTLRVRIDGVDMTDTTETGVTAAVATTIGLGANPQLTSTMRFSRAMFGYAANNTDWLGQPSSGQTILPDADTMTTGWTTTPLFSKINDSNDATFVSATSA